LASKGWVHRICALTHFRSFNGGKLEQYDGMTTCSKAYERFKLGLGGREVVVNIS